MLRHLHMLHITGMDEEDIRTIFSTILKWYHVSSNFPEPILNLRESIVEGALTVYKAVASPVLCCAFAMQSLTLISIVPRCDILSGPDVGAALRPGMRAAETDAELSALSLQHAGSASHLPRLLPLPWMLSCFVCHALSEICLEQS